METLAFRNVSAYKWCIGVGGRRREVTMFLILAAISFAMFFANVLFASAGWASPLGNLGELALLVVATVCFVIAVLQAEKREYQK
jgi:hypothetical protein